MIGLETSKKSTFLAQSCVKSHWIVTSVKLRAVLAPERADLVILGIEVSVSLILYTLQILGTTESA